MQLKETILKSEIVYKGSFLTIESNTVKLPNENTSIRECVIHPGSSAIVAVNQKGEVILEKQFRAATGKVMLEIPSGIINEGEDFLSAAKRELKEETGYTATEWIELGKFYPQSGYSNQQTHLFVAKGLSLSHQHLDDDEFLEICYMPFDELLRKVTGGEIEDANTCVAITRAQKYLLLGAGGN